MAAQRKHKLIVGAYRPQGEKHPVLIVFTSKPPNGAMTWCSPVIRRSEAAYMALYYACSGKPIWLYGQEPQSLQ